MDHFRRAQAKDVHVGGYKCPCCTPLTKRNQRKSKTALHKRTRSRLKQELSKTLEMVDTSIVDGVVGPCPWEGA